jgi:hypothetical protein
VCASLVSFYPGCMLQLHNLCLVSSGVVALLFCLFLCGWSLALVVVCIYMCFRVSPKVVYVFLMEKTCYACL